MFYWDLEAEFHNCPWIQTSRALSCSPTAWTNSKWTWRTQCASTQYLTPSTSSAPASTASCKLELHMGSVTSWAAPWWAWAPQAQPPCCLDTLLWEGSAHLSPVHLSTTTETTTPAWVASRNPAPSAPWRVAVWAVGRRAAATGEEWGNSAPTVSQTVNNSPVFHWWFCSQWW